MNSTNEQSYARAKKHLEEMMEAYATADKMEHEARTAKTRALQNQKNAKTALEAAKRSGNFVAIGQATDQLKAANRALAAARKKYRSLLNLLGIAAEAAREAEKVKDSWTSQG